MRLAAKAATTSLCGLLLLAFTGGGLSGVAVAAVVATNPCSRPDSLLRAGDFKAAYAAYRAVNPAGATCARPGMAAAGALQAASQLISVGLVTEADAEIVRAVNADPTLTLPVSLLSRTDTGRAIALAEALNADGFHRQAAQIMLFVTEAHPRIQLDPTAQDILNPPSESTSASVWQDLVAIGGIALVVIVLLIMVASFYPLTRRRLHLQPFTLEGAETGADAEHLRDRIREELKRLAVKYAKTDKGRRPRIDIAGPYDEPQDIGAVVDKAPSLVQFIYALTGLAFKSFPRLCRPRLATGALCSGIEVKMGIQTVYKAELRRTTIKHDGLGFPAVSASAGNPMTARYAQLALPAAAWVIFEMYDHVTLGGTRNQDSFNKFAVGYAWEQENPAEAERYYLQARDADPRNTAAKVNLGRLRQRHDFLSGAAAPDDSGWRDILSEVVDETKPEEGDFQWFQASYLLSLGLADRDRQGEDTQSVEERRQAKEVAIDLAVKVMTQLREPGSATMKDFLESCQGPALALAVSQMIPTTDNVDEIITTGYVPDNVTQDDVLHELIKARDSGAGAPELIVPFIEACEPDGEKDYNLVRYEKNRQQACAEVIAVIEEKLEEAGEQELDESPVPDAYYPPEGTGEEARLRTRQGSEAVNEEPSALQTQLKQARDAARDAESALNRYTERISRSANPELRARMDRLIQEEPPAERPTEESQPENRPQGNRGEQPPPDMRRELRRLENPWEVRPHHEPDGTLEPVPDRPVSPARRQAVYDAYLSYQHEDRYAVTEIVAALSRRGLKTYSDLDLKPGEPWEEALSTALENSRAMCVCIGASTVSSRFLADEIETAMSYGAEFPVIPILLPGAPDPPSLPDYLSEHQWIDLRVGLDSIAAISELADYLLELRDSGGIS
jgi:hypothetical protein